MKRGRCVSFFAVELSLWIFFFIKYSHCCTVFPFQMSRSDKQVPLGFGSSVLTIDKVLGYEEEWYVSGQKYSPNSRRWNNTYPCSPKGFHGNPVYISFGRDMWLFLEDLKATKNDFHFYSKTDLVSRLWTLSPSAHMHINTHGHTHTHTHTHTHIPEKAIIFSLNLGAAGNPQPSPRFSFSTSFRCWQACLFN